MRERKPIQQARPSGIESRAQAEAENDPRIGLPHRLDQSNWRQPLGDLAHPQTITSAWFIREHRLNNDLDIAGPVIPVEQKQTVELTQQILNNILNRFNSAWNLEGPARYHAAGSFESIARAERVYQALQPDRAWLEALEQYWPGLGQLIDALFVSYQELARVIEADASLDRFRRGYKELSNQLARSRQSNLGQGAIERLFEEQAKAKELYSSRVHNFARWQQAIGYFLTRFGQYADDDTAEAQTGRALIERIIQDIGAIYQEQLGESHEQKLSYGLIGQNYGANLLLDLGCQVYLPPAAWDASLSTDLIATHPQQPDQYWLVQLKSAKQDINLRAQIAYSPYQQNYESYNGYDRLIKAKTSPSVEPSFARAMQRAGAGIGREAKIGGLWLVFGGIKPETDGYLRYPLAKSGQPVFDHIQETMVAPSLK